ncbi:tetratricopeptide repeat protein [Marinoscillum pacificum]|uniref:tetratricopeptide repeat protein n=1 Tax=Marinoscillum pacificum TaxID=392723 RepID=UPI0021584511|nr:CDC27 family protein [Marinoscillum pacificum]
MRAFIIGGLVLLSLAAFSQKKKKGSSDFSPIDVTELSPGEKLKAETIIIDAERELILENYFKALELFKSALEITPDDAVVNFKIAEILTKNGDNSGALVYATKAAELDKTNKYYLLLAAEIHKSLSNYKEATAIYQRMIDNVEGTEEYLFDLAILYQFQGEDQKALETYSRAEAVFGVNEIVLREKQKIYLKKKDYEGLMKEWDKLIAEHPGEDTYTIELAQFLITHNMIDEAKERLQQLHSGQQRDLLMSQIMLTEGKTGEALELASTTLESKDIDYASKLQILNSLLQNALTTEDFDMIMTLTDGLADQYPEIYEVQAFSGDVMYQLENQEKALEYYVKAVEVDPAHFETWQNILQIEASLSDFDAMIKHSEKAMEYFPNQGALYYFCGTGYLVNKEYKKSIQIFEQGKRYVTNSQLKSVFYGQMGDAYNSLKQYQKSYDSYESALKENPTNDHVLNNYSFFLSLKKEKLDKAIEMSTKLVELHPDNPTYLDTHGWVLYTLEKYDEALVYLRKAANLQEDGTVIEHYGDVLYKLGKVDQAVEQWRRASLLNDASELINQKIEQKKLLE